MVSLFAVPVSISFDDIASDEVASICSSWRSMTNEVQCHGKCWILQSKIDTTINWLLTKPKAPSLSGGLVKEPNPTTDMNPWSNKTIDRAQMKPSLTMTRVIDDDATISFRENSAH
mmetsp:Transcript_2245/g.4257  ORF Transcript_2245/g.4257 Transcript_2245/m.4257 type:complete len:116 (-) Transcript_2245:529-876(-)